MIILTWTLGIVLLVLGCFCVFLIKTNLELEDREYEKFMSKVDIEMQSVGSEPSGEDYELIKKNTRMLQ